MLLVASSLSANAATIITGTTATATSHYGGNEVPANLVNGSGLTGTGITATHGQFGNTNMWHAGNGQGGGAPAPVVDDQFVTISLGGTYNIESIYIWQHNQTGNFGRGVNQFDLLYSTDGGLNFTASSSNNTLAISTGGNISALQFAMSHTGVTHVRIEIDTAHSGAVNEYVGLSEVMITTVPEPTSSALLAFGTISLLLRRKR